MSDPPPFPRAYVTLLTDEGFLNGALCLLRSLACTSVPTSVPTVAVMVTPAVGRLARARLQRVGAVVIEVQPIPLALGPAGPTSAAAATSTTAYIHDGVSTAGAGSEAVEPRVSPPSESVASADRGPSPASAGTSVTSHVPSWTAAGLTKLHLWNLTQFSKVVYLDADTIVLNNVDELFDRPGTPLAAAPDLFPPDHFNAGVLVVDPDAAVFASMVAASGRLHSYDGGDTGFLNAYFPDWFELPSAHRLPYVYNAQRTLQWLTKAAPGYWAAVVAKGIKVLHFSSSPKPWQTKPGGAQSELDMVWWSVFTDGKIPTL